MEEICRLVVEFKLTETEAALQLGFNQHQYFNFKNRQKHIAKFEDILSRIRAANITSTISKIKAAGDGIANNRPDWRAHAFILERVVGNGRFDQKQSDDTRPANNIVVQISSELAQKAFERLAMPVIDVKAIGNGADTTNNEG